MRVPQRVALLGSMVLLTACGPADGMITTGEDAVLETNDQKAAYGIGLNIGAQLVETKNRLDRAAFLRGIEDAIQEADPVLDQAELQEVLAAFAEDMQAEAEAEYTAEADENLAAGEAYQAENGAKAGVTTTESGLQYEVLRQGDGAMPGLEDDVRLHYRGTLVDGEQFDSSYDRGEPAQFNVSQVVPGFTESLMLMAVGSHFRVVLPYALAYGPQGPGRGLGPHSTLVFEIELLEIVGGG